MTCFGQLVSSCNLDLRSDFEIDLSRSKYVWYNVSWEEKHDSVKVIVLPFLYEKRFQFFILIIHLPWCLWNHWPHGPPQILQNNVTGALQGYLMFFWKFYSSIIVLQILTRAPLGPWIFHRLLGGAFEHPPWSRLLIAVEKDERQRSKVGDKSFRNHFSHFFWLRSKLRSPGVKIPKFS